MKRPPLTPAQIQAAIADIVAMPAARYAALTDIDVCRAYRADEREAALILQTAHGRRERAA